MKTPNVRLYEAKSIWAIKTTSGVVEIETHSFGPTDDGCLLFDDGYFLPDGWSDYELKTKLTDKWGDEWKKEWTKVGCSGETKDQYRR